MRGYCYINSINQADDIDRLVVMALATIAQVVQHNGLAIKITNFKCNQRVDK